MDREAQIVALMPDAEILAERCRRRMPWLDGEELRSEAYVALVRAVDTHEPALGKIGPRVAYKVRCALAEYVRDKRACVVRTPRSRAFSMLVEMPVVAPVLPAYDERLDRAKLCRRVRAAVDALPAISRTTALDIMRGVSIAQAARLCGVTERAISGRRATVKRRLRFLAIK